MDKEMWYQYATEKNFFIAELTDAKLRRWWAESIKGGIILSLNIVLEM